MTWRNALWIALLLLTWTVADAGHVYGWIDQQGNVQYADRPPAKQPEQGYLAPVPPSVEERIEQAKLEAWRRQVAEYEKLQTEMREAAVRREADEDRRRYARRGKCRPSTNESRAWNGLSDAATGTPVHG